MSTVTLITQRLKDRLSALPGVDQASMDDYTPPIKTTSIALVFPALGTQGRVERPTKNGFTVNSHRIPAEFWVKADPAKPAETMRKARDIALLAIRTLLQDPTLGGAVQAIGYYGHNGGGLSIEYEVSDRPVTVGGVSYIVANVFVPVMDYDSE